MDVKEIKKLEEVLLLDSTQTIIDHKIKRLTAPGENYGSLILSVDITVQTLEGTEEIHTVAKMAPPNDFIQEIFNTQVTFRNEIAFYDIIVPTLQNFQREQGMTRVIDCFPKYYGGRINLTGDDTKVDSDAVLLLENLKIENYINYERTQGFDLEVAKLVIADLALLHAVPLALKMKKPDVFEKKIKKYLLTNNKPHGDAKFAEKLLDLINSVDEIKQYVSRAREPLSILNKNQPPPREPFATIVHDDCWVNNTMVKVENGKPVKNKLVDFQICQYGSPARDLLFFIFSSVENEVLLKHCDDLIEFYHKNFMSVLRQLKVDSFIFNRQAFEKELEIEARNSQFAHLVLMLAPIFSTRESAKEISEYTEQDFFKTMGSPTDLAKDKLKIIVKEFVKRDWI